MNIPLLMLAGVIFAGTFAWLYPRVVARESDPGVYVRGLHPSLVQPLDKLEEMESVRLHRELLDAFDAEMGGMPVWVDGKGGPKLMKLDWEMATWRTRPQYTPLQSAGQRRISVGLM